jgi:hypothetical protein
LATLLAAATGILLGLAARLAAAALLRAHRTLLTTAVVRRIHDKSPFRRNESSWEIDAGTPGLALV